MIFMGDVMKLKKIGLVAAAVSSFLFCGIHVSASDFVPTHMSDVVGIEELYSVEDTEEQIAEEIELGEIEVLAQLIEAEAGCEDYHGKCLVADVVLNRVASDTFPDTISEVVFQYKTRKSDGEDCYQFATVKYGTFDDAGWYISDDSFKAAYEEYYAERRIDADILYFTAGSYNAYCTPAYKYGRHYFGY